MAEKYDINDFGIVTFPPDFFKSKTAQELGISEEHRQELIEFQDKWYAKKAEIQRLIAEIGEEAYYKSIEDAERKAREEAHRKRLPGSLKSRIILYTRKLNEATTDEERKKYERYLAICKSELEKLGDE